MGEDKLWSETFCLELLTPLLSKLYVKPFALLEEVKCGAEVWSGGGFCFARAPSKRQQFVKAFSTL